MKHLLFPISLLFVLVCSCAKDRQAAFDRQAIEDYLSSNGLTATEHSSGIFYIISMPGSGDNPTSDSKVTVRYNGYYLDGFVFDQTTGSDTRTFSLNGVIEGWKIAIPLLKKGGKGTFFIPSELGYGGVPPDPIRENAVLVFDVELVDFQ